MNLLITGASGQLGGYLLRELPPGAATAWSHSRTGELFGHPLHPVDLADRDQVVAAFRSSSPTAILHLGAFTTVAGCLADPERANRVNVQGTALLAELATAAKARLVMVSTDLVFDGAKGRYREGDAPGPLSAYGRSKLEGESAVLESPGGVVARLSLLFGPTVIGRHYFFDQQVEKMRAGETTTWFEDEWRSPLGLLVAARALMALVQADFTGLIHLGGPELMNRYELGQRLAAYYGADPAKVLAVSRLSTPAPEPRPCDVSLDSSLWRSEFPGQWWPGWVEAMDAMAQQQINKYP